MAVADPILIRFRAALDKTYGARIERVVLFGSHGAARSGRIPITTLPSF